MSQVFLTVLTAALALAVAATSTGCTSTPTQPSKSAALVIRPPVDGIVIGKSQVYHAWLTDQNGEHEVDANWLVSDPTVANVSATGTVNGLRLGTTMLTAISGGLSGDRALVIVSDFSGHWQGTAKITECSRQSGEGPNTCGAEVGLVLPVDLVLNQDGNSITGTATLHRIVVTGPVSGTALPAGSMTLTGTLRTNDGDHPFQMVITHWDTSLDAEGRLTGTFRITDTFQNAFGTQVHLEQYEMISVTRSPS